jgi:hypothetical protein
MKQKNMKALVTVEDAYTAMEKKTAEGKLVIPVSPPTTTPHS